MSEINLRNDPARHQYELLDGGKRIGKAVYQEVGGAVMLTHTEVDESYEGEGLGSRLIKYALEDVRSQGKLVIPLCPFVAAYVRRHPEYLDLIHPQQRGMFGIQAEA